MPRNNLKNFPTAMTRRGLAHFHPASHATVQAPIDPPGNLPADSIEPPPFPAVPARPEAPPIEPFVADSMEPEVFAETVHPLAS
jgi:hypothetical protein